MRRTYAIPLALAALVGCFGGTIANNQDTSLARPSPASASRQPSRTLASIASSSSSKTLTLEEGTPQERYHSRQLLQEVFDQAETWRTSDQFPSGTLSGDDLAEGYSVARFTYTNSTLPEPLLASVDTVYRKDAEGRVDIRRAVITLNISRHTGRRDERGRTLIEDSTRTYFLDTKALGQQQAIGANGNKTLLEVLAEHCGYQR